MLTNTTSTARDFSNWNTSDLVHRLAFQQLATANRDADIFDALISRVGDRVAQILVNAEELAICAERDADDAAA